MKKIFLKNNTIKDEFILVNSLESNHIMNSLRYKIGDQIIVSNEDDLEYTTKIIDYTKGNLKLKIEEAKPLQKNKREITLVQGLCKGDKMDFIIQKATEMGIRKIIPVETMRTIVKLDDKKSMKKIERWQKIADEAAKQSNAPLIPEVSKVNTLRDIEQNIEKNTKYILLWEEEKELKLSEVLKKTTEEKIVLIVGPEGGFDEREVNTLKEKGVYVVTLGEKILRTETAALAASAIVMYHFGELG